MTTNGIKRFDDYPVRPDMVLGESLSGYVYRFLAANGHKVPIHIYAELIGYCSKEPKRAAQSQFVLQSMLGNKIGEERTEWLQHWLIIKGSYHVGSEYVRTVRFCPFCLEDKQFHFALWAFPFVVACPEHCCMLLSGCYQCRKPFSWIGMLPGWHCKCGASVQAYHAEKADQKLVMWSNFVASARDMKTPEGLKARLANTTFLNRYDLKVLPHLLKILIGVF